MGSIWQAPKEIRDLVTEVRDEHHPHLTAASFWVLVSDRKAISDNRVIVTTSKKCTKEEKLSTGHDFKIVVLAESWANLPDSAREIAIDEALCRCGVQYVPQSMEVNGKKEIVKDDLGRVIYTDQVAYDNEGNPKWRINRPDAGLYYDMILRHGQYSEEAENVALTLKSKAPKQPTIAVRADVIDEIEAPQEVGAG